MSVSGGYVGLEGALSATFEKFKESDIAKSEFAEYKTTFSTGGENLPAPIGLKLLPIVEAFSESHFENLDQQFQCEGLTQRKTNLNKLLNEYPTLKHVSKPYGMINHFGAEVFNAVF